MTTPTFLPVRTLQRVRAAQIGIPPWQGIPFPPAAINAITGNTDAGLVNLGNGTPAAQWRYWPLINSVEVIGSLGGPLSALNAGAGILGGTFPFGNWRCPYPPAHTTLIGLAFQGNTAAGSNAFQVDTTGLFTWANSGPASAVSCSFHAFYSCDA